MITYNDIPLEAYVRMLKVHSARTEETDYFDYQCNLISAVYDRPVHEIKLFPAGKFNQIWGDVQYLSSKPYTFPVTDSITFEGKVYKFGLRPQEVSVAQFADLEWVGLNYEGLDRLIPTMALITTPTIPQRKNSGRKKNYYNGNDRLSLIPLVSKFPTEQCWGALDFFIKKLTVLNTISQQFTGQILGKVEEQVVSLSKGTAPSSS